MHSVGAGAADDVVSDPDISRPRLIRDASFLEADRREIALRRGRHNANRELGRALKTEFVLQYMSEPQLWAARPH